MKNVVAYNIERDILKSKTFPCGSAGKQSTCNVGDLGSILGLGRSWESQFLGRLIRSSGFLRTRKGFRALEKEKGVWTSQGEKDKPWFLHCFVLVNIIMYLAWGNVSPNILTNPVILKCILWSGSGKIFLFFIPVLLI